MAKRLLGILLLSTGSVVLTGGSLYLLLTKSSVPANPPVEATTDFPELSDCTNKYTSTSYGFEFCYPTIWKLGEFGDKKEIVGVDPKSAPKEGGSLGLIQIMIQEARSSDLLFSLRTMLDKEQEERETLSGVDGTRITGEVRGKLHTSVVVTKGKYTYEISIQDDVTNYQKYLPVFENLLGSWQWK